MSRRRFLRRVRGGAPAVLVVLAAVVLGAACEPTPPASPIRISHPTSLVGTAWRVVSIQGRQPPAGPDLTIAFGRSGDVTGAGACNSFGGTFLYDPTSGAVRIDALSSTKRACVEPARNEVETVYFQALRAVAQAGIDPDGRLVLTGSGAEVVLAVGPARA